MQIATRFLLAACLAVSLAGSAFAAPETYEIDPAHTTIGFKVKHLFSFVTGRFTTVSGTIAGDADKPEASSVNATIQIGTISTANEKRDGHLKSPDFFDAAKFPTMTYVSKSVKKTGENEGEIIGDLTMHGVTKSVPLKVHFLGKGPGMQGEMRAGFEATADLKRSDFGLVWNKIIEGTSVVGDDVSIMLEIEAIKKP